MAKISSGIQTLDGLLDSFSIGDNVVWETDVGTSYELFIQSFVKRSSAEAAKVIYVSFNKSPQTVLGDLMPLIDPQHFTLIDCFTSGKGKNDNTFRKFYESMPPVSVVMISDPKDINEFTRVLTAIEDGLPPGARYIFDSLTGMQDLWGGEEDTFKFFTYMCPRLYDLDTVAYWIVEKDAHSQKFKANIRHITQVVLDLSPRKEKLFLKALKLDGRDNREAFKPHQYMIDNNTVTLAPSRREISLDIGGRIREIRTRLSMSQKDLADKIGLTSSFISQIENNQISPSLHSFLQIAAALGIDPTSLLADDRSRQDAGWLIRRESADQSLCEREPEYATFSIVSGDTISAYITVITPGATLKRHFLNYKKEALIHILKGKVSVKVDLTEREVKTGDSVYLRDLVPSTWINKTDKEVELLVVSM